MARVGVTFEQVSAAADSMVAAGEVPTIQRIRASLGGTGSPNTIHRHLVVWRSMKPVAQRRAPELPPDLQAALAREIERQAAAARAEVEAALVESQSESSALADAGEAFEVERDALATVVSSLTTEKDTLLGRLEQQASDLADAQQRILREQAAAEAARVELAKAQLKIESHAENAVLQLAEIERLRVQVHAETQARVAAEQRAAVLVAKLEASTERLTELETGAAVMRERHESLVVERDDLRASLAASREQTAVLSARLEAAAAAAQREREAADALKEELADLRSRVFHTPA